MRPATAGARRSSSAPAFNAPHLTAVRVELVYDASCPNVERARDSIRTALAIAGVPVEWTEWERGNDATPLQLRMFGSPTVLVNGSDVAGGNEPAQADANSCRVYLDECGCLCGAPTSRQIIAAIESTRGTS